MVSEIGYETDGTINDFSSQKEKDPFFSIGIRWQPKGVLDLNLNYEDHYYGDFISASAIFDKNHLLVSLIYDQEVTTDRDEDIRNITATPGTPSAPTQNDASETFLQKTTTGTAVYSYDRGKITIEARLDERITEDQISLGSRPNEEISEVRIAWDHQLTRRHNLLLGFKQRNRNVSNTRKDYESYVSLRINYEVNSTLSGGFYVN